MKCEDFNNLATDYADGLLDGAQRASAEEHARACAQCRATLDSTLDVFSSLKSAALPDPGELFWRKFNDDIRAQLAPPAATAASATRRYAAAAAAAAVLLISAAGFPRIGNAPPSSPFVNNNASYRDAAAALSPSDEAELIIASLEHPAEIPSFRSIAPAGDNSQEAVASADDQAAEILDAGAYDSAASHVYNIPEEVQNLTGEEARDILETLPAAGPGDDT